LNTCFHPVIALMANIIGRAAMRTLGMALEEKCRR
jgi:hypothetical protein